MFEIHATKYHPLDHLDPSLTFIVSHSHRPPCNATCVRWHLWHCLPDRYVASHLQQGLAMPHVPVWPCAISVATVPRSSWPRGSAPPAVPVRPSVVALIPRGSHCHGHECHLRGPPSLARRSLGLPRPAIAREAPDILSTFRFLLFNALFFLLQCVVLPVSTFRYVNVVSV